MNIFLLCGLVCFSALAITMHNLLKSAICLGVASIFLAVLFFRMGAPYAGVFEVSIVAGLITVLFITTIVLTKREGGVKERKLTNIFFLLFFIIFIMIDFFVMKGFIGNLPNMPVGSPNLAENNNFSKVLWQYRTLDLVGQICAIFAGVFSVLALFRADKKENNNE
ncbi:MAG: NADH-quinone oxidoreductase subunit J [bacterium]|nr:NADH-quinone oxidoreductase subunit J [bacterium]